MLILSRNKDESVIIGEGDSQVKVTIIDVRGDKVRIGFEAAREVPIHRTEVYNAIQRSKK